MFVNKSVVVVFICLLKMTSGTLLYPESTAMQLTGSVSIPITPLPLKRRAYFDWGLQMNYNMPFNLSSFYMAPIWVSRYNEISKREILYNDFTPMEFYESMEKINFSYGFHKTCWKRSICELARHPFDAAHGNWLTDLITFVMTPSHLQMNSQHHYMLAESQGRADQSCDQLYPECEDDPLHLLTTIEE
ncbi:uncharacterized protein LOC142219975 [Haematobia irritans]|uniref:uncharacterized protein LOC142219975 n=1 Tax=Haematobia irritans TaxID=7368 RepID=UPI003F4F6B44